MNPHRRNLLKEANRPERKRYRMEKPTFVQNVELDAMCVLGAMRGGMHGMFEQALRFGIESPDLALKRAEWLKKQPEAYIKQVSDKAAELEGQQNG